MTLNYFDDTTNKPLYSATATGEIGAPVVATNLPGLVASGYKVLTPVTAVFSENMAPITIHLAHEIADVNPAIVPVKGQPVPGLPGVVWTADAPVGWKDLMTKTTSFTVRFNDFLTDQTLAPTVTQKWTYTQTGKVDLVTFTFTGNNDWTTTDPAYQPVTIPQFKGMTPSYNSVSYVPQPGYNKTITVYYTQNPTKDLAPETKTVTRTINVKNPDGTVKTTTQTANFSRTVTQDMVTGDLTYGQWNDNQQWDDFKPAVIDGYTASQTDVPEVHVTADDTDQTVNVDYIANLQSTTITYITAGGQPATQPDGTAIPDVPVNGKTDEKVPVTDKINGGIPTGWELVPDQNLPKDVTFGANGADPIPVKIQHKLEVEAPDTKTVTRTINVTDPVTGKVTSTTQTAHFTRTVTKDLVTGDPIYGDWNTDQKWDAFTTPTIDGYTASQTSVSKQAVTADDKDQTVDITYEQIPNPGQGSGATPSGAPSGTPSQAPSETPSEVPSQTPGMGTGVMPSGQPGSGSGPALNQSGKVGMTTAAMTKAPGAAQKRLPQTGNDDQKATAIAGLSLMGVVASLLGMGKQRKHEN